jgi:hypothetical protein
VDAADPVEVLTQTFTPPEIVKMKTYDLRAAPLVYPGQIVTAVLHADRSNNAPVTINIRLKHYNEMDTLSTFDGLSIILFPCQDQRLSWTIPHAFGGQPIQQLGLALSCPTGYITGKIYLDSLLYRGSPRMTLQRPAAAQSDPFQPAQPGKPCDFWRRAWIDSLSTFNTRFPKASFYLSQDQGEGILITGTRDWVDYRVMVPRFRINMGSAGLAVRVQGLNRYYAILFQADRKSVAFARDESRVILASVDLSWELDEELTVSVCVEKNNILGYIGSKKVLGAQDAEYSSGGIGAVLVNGSVAIDQFDIAPLPLGSNGE